jgi:LysM repeat protein
MRGLFPVAAFTTVLAACVVAGLSAAYTWTGQATGTFQAKVGVCGPIPATIDIDPDTLNPGSQGNFVTTYIELPEGWDAAEVDIHTVQFCLDEDCTNAEEHPTDVGDEDQDGIPDRMVKFSREAVVALLRGRTDAITLRVTGEISGTTFEATDSIRVLNSQGDVGDAEPALPEEDPGEAAAPPEPPPSTPSMPTLEYEVKPGDTLWNLGRRFGTDVGILMGLNGLKDPRMILYGSTLIVPYVRGELGGVTAGVSP